MYVTNQAAPDGAMQIGSWDSETVCFAPGMQAPTPVCISWASGESYGIAPAHQHPLRELLASGVTWCGVNIAYDFACVIAWGLLTSREVFEAYDRDQIIDLAVYERVAEIGGWTPKKGGDGGLGLASLHRVYGLGELEKGPVRTSYGPLLGRPLEEYSQDQIRYSILDSIAGVKVFERQLKRHGQRVNLVDVAALTRQQLWLHLCRTWGLRTDPSRVDVLEAETDAAIIELEAIAKEQGYVRADGSRDMKAIKAAVNEAYEGDPPMTTPARNRKSTKPFVAQISTAKDTLVQCGDPLLEALADFGSWKKIRGTDLVFLKAGTVEPIHTRFGIADTTRTTSSGPNVQNITRASRKDCRACGKSAPAFTKACVCGARDWQFRQGTRECFVPRTGNCYVAIDHSGLELCGLGQVCVSRLGRWDLANRLNSGVDMHAAIAAEIMQISYAQAIELKNAGDKELKNARNCGKVVNFGRPGGMAAKTLVIYAKSSYGIDLTLEFATELIRHWEVTNPDGVAFLAYIRSLQRGRRFDLVIPGTTIQRNQTTYCSAANCHFQGLGAALERAIGWEIARAQYVDDGVLSLARTVNFIHDEFIVECPIGWQTQVSEALHSIMTGPIARRFLPDVRIQAEFAAMIRWSKAAEEKRGPDGDLLIWGLDYAA